MGILDAFKQDCQDNPNVANGDSALQAEINKQLKAIADYDANPEILDSKIKFNPEEFDFDEKKISKRLYDEEENQYPEADDPVELLKTTIDMHLMGDPGLLEDSGKINGLDDFDNFFNLTKCECNEVKVGDKLKIYNENTQSFDTVEVFSINKCYNPLTYEPEVVVTVNYDYDGTPDNNSPKLRKLSDPKVYYKVGGDEPIKQFTMKDDK